MNDDPKKILQRINQLRETRRNLKVILGGVKAAKVQRTKTLSQIGYKCFNCKSECYRIVSFNPVTESNRSDRGTVTVECCACQELFEPTILITLEQYENLKKFTNLIEE